jgi:hypothetical protein
VRRDADFISGLADGAEGISAFGPRAWLFHPSPSSVSDGSTPFIRSFSTCEARKTRTRRGSIRAGSPVFGLRPQRSPFSRTEKLPKDEILTVSPFASASATSFSTDSTNSAASTRDSPTSRQIASLKSARVIVRPGITYILPIHIKEFKPTE